ncbi:hypothetical protein AB0B30_24025 [Streptomyces narbonensis]|uniref:Uncharacterized protein n=1 Tax=Streptomyces narbonensis TaxID=67333 RepID=A0ABV3CHG4_9ACTN
MENNDDITLLRDAMDRTAGDLPPLPDLAPLAVREGRRRRARSRFAVGAAAVGVVTAGALGLTLLPQAGPGTTVSAVSTPVAGGAKTSYPPVVVEETPGVTPPDDPEGLPRAERERRAQHQQKMAALLDELLPATITAVSPVKDRTAEYRITADGETFRMVVSVRPADDLSLRYCATAPKDDPACEGLRGGPISVTTTRVTTQYMYRNSWVELTVYTRKAEEPVTVRHLLGVAEDPRFLELVKEADARPMEAPEPPLGTPAGADSRVGQRAR